MIFICKYYIKYIEEVNKVFLLLVNVLYEWFFFGNFWFFIDFKEIWFKDCFWSYNKEYLIVRCF